MKRYTLLLIITLFLLMSTSCSNNSKTPTDSGLPSQTAEAAASSTTSESSIVPDTKESESPVSESTKTNNETVVSSIPKSQQTQSQAENKQITKTLQSSKSAESSKTKETTKSTEPPKDTPKSAFAKPFDIETMKSKLIDYGKDIGMTHITNLSEDFGGDKITPDNSTSLPPIETWNYSSSKADKLKQDICDDIKHWKDRGVTTFTLWFEKDSSHSGDYIIYVLIG